MDSCKYIYIYNGSCTVARNRKTGRFFFFFFFSNEVPEGCAMSSERREREEDIRTKFLEVRTWRLWFDNKRRFSRSFSMFFCSFFLFSRKNETPWCETLRRVDLNFYPTIVRAVATVAAELSERHIERYTDERRIQWYEMQCKSSAEFVLRARQLNRVKRSRVMRNFRSSLRDRWQIVNIVTALFGCNEVD